jgi:hypothetical protein
MELSGINVRPRKRGAPGLVADYQAVAGCSRRDDRCRRAAIRPSLAAADLGALDELGSEELTGRFQRADQYLRDAGVYLPQV